MKRPDSKNFKMPYVETGMTVMWSPGAGATFVPALVTKVGVNSITVALLRSGATSFIPKESVRHASDPGFKKLHDPSKTGCWEFRDQDVMLAMIAVKTLGAAVAKDTCPAFASLVDAYTPDEQERETTSSYSDDDPDVHGA